MNFEGLGVEEWVDWNGVCVVLDNGCVKALLVSPDLPLLLPERCAPVHHSDVRRVEGCGLHVALRVRSDGRLMKRMVGVHGALAELGGEEMHVLGDWEDLGFCVVVGAVAVTSVTCGASQSSV